MAARPSSPTSLLWAHQLKREHGYLLKRMQEVEASNERQAKRIKKAETAATSGFNADIAALAKQVKALDEDHVRTRLSKLEDDFKQKTEKLEAGTETISTQIAAVKRDAEGKDEEKRKAFCKEKALLKRIVELETGLDTYKQQMDQIGQSLDQPHFDHVKDQLEALSKQVLREGSHMKMLAESVTALEGANQELKKSNHQMAAKLEGVIASRRAVCSDATQVDATTSVMRNPLSDIIVAPQRSTRSKRHRSSNGGADRDIIAHSTQMFGTDTISAVSQGHEESECEARLSEKARAPPKHKQKGKPVPRHLHAVAPINATNFKSHKWSGGGADKDVIRSGRTRVVALGPSGAATVAKGAAQLVLPQPKKRIVTPHWTVEEAMTQGRTTRRGNQAQNAPKAGDDVQSQPMVKEKTDTKALKPTTKLVQKRVLPQHRRPLNEVAPSLVITSPPGRQAAESPGAAPRPRRRIIQDD